MLHRFDGGMLQALIQLSKSRVLSYGSLRDTILFTHEPPLTAAERLSGYVDAPTTLRSILEQFLEGCGVPNEQLGLEVGVENLARSLGEDLGDAGARSRLFLLAATSSSSLTPQTSISVSLLH